MIGDLVRIVADWLEDGTHGVGAMLANVPRDVGDALPATPTVIEETANPRLGRGRLPETTMPYLAVTAEAVTAIDAEVVTDDGYFSAAVRIQYVGKDDDAAGVKRDGGYTLRAVVWSLRRLMRQDAGAAGRQRNSIALVRLGPITVEPWQEDLNDGTVIGGLVLQCPAVRDFYTL
ncbi:MAG: hypothetical protein IT352_07550 [Gemmatimonadales bacterium]|nr:hypothetical protein [Gemmatimonadales bacterium]